MRGYPLLAVRRGHRQMVQVSTATIVPTENGPEKLIGG